MSYWNAAAAAPPGHLELDVLQILLMHAPSIMSTRDLGRLSLCSKTISKIMDDAVVWKGFFDKAVAAGQTCISDDDWAERITWNGEPGLLECFAHPSPLVIKRVGYKHAAGCLLSKTCFHCGTMSGGANPLTMTRICRACLEVKESSWTITKCKAKEAFLLTDKDCAAWALPSASSPFGFFGNTNGANVLFLLLDVVAASFAKWGGPDGLESEIIKRKATSAKRYAKRQSSSKPQKKRPKIESLSSRPGDDLLSLRSSLGPTLPIPVPYFRCSELKMTHCTKCSACDVRGTKKDMVMHEILEHGLFHLHAGRKAIASSPTESPGTIPESIHPAEELVTLLERAEVKYDETHYENENTGSGGHSTCLITLGDCKVAVDFKEYGDVGQGTGTLVVLYQPGQNMLPVKLCEIWFGGAGDFTTEAETFFFDKLKEALNLRETRSNQLLAALVWRATPNLNSETVNMYGWQGNYLKARIFCSAWDILGRL